MARIVLYDRTCRTQRGRLTPVWFAGSHLYRALGRVDETHGVSTWDEALGLLATRSTPIEEIQYWGHGRWGRVLVADDALDRDGLDRHASAIAAIRERLTPDALIWLRTCEAFGARAGHDFAQALADRFGVRVAGHTYVIAFQQSGLHGLAPGMRPDWPADEGIAEGTPEAPVRARWSDRRQPHTVTALTGRVPPAWFSSTR